MIRKFATFLVHLKIPSSIVTVFEHFKYGSPVVFSSCIRSRTMSRNEFASRLSPLTALTRARSTVDRRLSRRQSTSPPTTAAQRDHFHYDPYRGSQFADKSRHYNSEGTTRLRLPDRRPSKRSRSNDRRRAAPMDSRAVFAVVAALSLLSGTVTDAKPAPMWAGCIIGCSVAATLCHTSSAPAALGKHRHYFGILPNAIGTI